jgi:hypothetical protein
MKTHLELVELLDLLACSGEDTEDVEADLFDLLARACDRTDI